ncbi:hypothetical protein [Hymenobacter rubripertinctus]|uniref:hypothetical protein n=1 Tax=Hymenobacter rubripertinctus TaxID=2029981 RepID=UPI0011C4448E|nr:hypothetical protein [Hymenobacter rubripertinctus]
MLQPVIISRGRIISSAGSILFIKLSPSPDLIMKLELINVKNAPKLLLSPSLEMKISKETPPTSNLVPSTLPNFNAGTFCREDGDEILTIIFELLLELPINETSFCVTL